MMKENKLRDVGSWQQIVLHRMMSEQFGMLWVRAWGGDGELPEWLEPAIKSATPCHAFGISDPLEFQLTRHELITVSAGKAGTTLVEALDFFREPFGETRGRELLEQIAGSLHRIYEGQGRVHGGLNPFNIRCDDELKVSLWSVPSARIELAGRNLDERWELPFRSPRLRSGETPDITDDLYSLGKLFASMLGRGWESLETDEIERFLKMPPEQMMILQYALRPFPSHDIRGLIELLNPQSVYLELDISGAAELGLEALKAYRKGLSEEALCLWQDALRRDWLDVSTHHNLGVTYLALGRWSEALEQLGKATLAGSNHCLLDCSRAHAHWKLGDIDLAELHLIRAHALNPRFHQPFRLRASITKESGRLSQAVDHIIDALRLSPKCRESRLLAADLLSRVGRETEAERHRQYGLSLAPEAPLADYLVHGETPPPWCIIKDQSQSILHRFLASPAKPNDRNFHHWLEEASSIHNSFRIE